MIKTAHEAPITAFKFVQKLTDIDYALVHLLDENRDYLKLFVQAVAEGREVILDNSIFELGTVFDPDKFSYWIKKLEPTWYIIPDVLEDCQGTINQLASWYAKYGNLPGKKIGVVQGKTYEEIVQCYKNIEPYVDMVGISFDYSFFEEWYPDMPTIYHSWMYGRTRLIARLSFEEVINTSKPHHLLGCGLPQEGKIGSYFAHDWIYSVDTSNPVVHGLKGIRYNEHGLGNKESQKLFTMINHQVTEAELPIIEYNIKSFRKFWNG